MGPQKTYTPPDPAERARKGKWLGDMIDATCGPCPERTPDDTGVIMNNDLLCNCGKSFIECQTFVDDLLARADSETDQAEKDEQLKFHTWLNRGAKR